MLPVLSIKLTMEEKRFQFITPGTLEKVIQSRTPRNTQRNTKWGINTWNAWIEARNSVRQPGHSRLPTALDVRFLGPLELNEHLCYFVLEVRTKSGEMYPKDSLLNLMHGLARYFKKDLQRPDLNFMNPNNICFNRFRQSLESQMKLADERGIGYAKKHAQAVTEAQEKVLWEKGILNVEKAEGMSKVVYFYNCKVFGLRGRNDHANLQVDQFTFGSDDAGKFIEFSEHINENTRGERVLGKEQLRHVRHYDTGKELSVYSVFKEYIDLIGNSGRFYRKPIPTTNYGDIQFSNRPLSVHAISSYIGTMMKEAGFIGHYTGYFGKTTLVAQLYENGGCEHLIKERANYRSKTGRYCKTTSAFQQKFISEMIDIPKHKAPRFSDMTILISDTANSQHNTHMVSTIMQQRPVEAIAQQSMTKQHSADTDIFQLEQSDPILVLDFSDDDDVVILEDMEDFSPKLVEAQTQTCWGDGKENDGAYMHKKLRYQEYQTKLDTPLIGTLKFE